MRVPSDFPSAGRRRGPSGRRRLGIGAIITLLAVLLGSIRGIAVFYTDFLWYGSVHLTSVWRSVLAAKLFLSVVAIAVFFALAWVNFYFVDRVAPHSIGDTKDDELARRYQQIVRPRAGRVRLAMAGVLAVLGGGSFYINWQDWLLFRNGGNFGMKDPQFHRDIGFFVFKLPFLSDITSWIFGSLVFIVIVTVGLHYLQGSIRLQVPSNRVTSAVKTHVSVLLGCLALVRAVQYYLERFELSFSTRGVVKGANYTDVKWLLPGLSLLILISLLAAALFFASSRVKGWALPVTSVAVWGLVSVLVGNALPAAVQKLSVDPAQSQKEAPYITRNLAATRQALGLAGVQVHDFPYTDQLTSTDLQQNAQTISNVRLWDPDHLTPSYQRLQENRSFFRFDDVDVDRYVLQGENTQTQMELSVRELNTAGLPAQSWVNQHLQYTHGYGAVASPANAVTSEGLPNFELSGVPPVGEPMLDQARAQVYFGEQNTDYTIVNTKQVEVDYTGADNRDQTSKYQGTGGVQLNSVVKKAAFAIRVGSVKPLISSLITPKSRAMYLANIRQRVEQAAPFLHYDADPYPVILNGRIKWIQDAYTTTDSYPYSEDADTSLLDPKSGLSNQAFNYLRNSVKVVTDAYDGTMTFYVMDNTDPIIKAWQKAFPSLFVDGAKMPSDLRAHVRYPEDLFRVQSSMFGSYHLNDPQDFYSKSDQWNIAQSPDVGSSSATVAPTTPSTVAANDAATTTPVPMGEKRIDPYYLLMRLPNEQDESFLMFQPYVPYSVNDERKELTAFMTVKSDPSHYGQMDVYVMPRGVQVDGPALVESRIQSDPTIKSQVTLLNQSGSTVQYGNMLIIPVNNGLLYVRPLYVTAQSTQVPEFKKAIVVQGNKIEMADTLQQALTAMFGSAPSTREQQRAPGASGSGGSGGSGQAGAGTAGTGGGLSQQTQALISQAQSEFDQANQALRNGDLAGYQLHVGKAADLVKQAGGG